MNHRHPVRSTIAVIVLESESPFFRALVTAARDVFEAAGYDLVSLTSDGDDRREGALLRSLEPASIAGVVLSPVRDAAAAIRRLRDLHLPAVLADRAGQLTGICSVAVDDVQGGRIAVDHLLDLGHHAVAVAGGPDGLQQVRDRRFGAALAARNAPQPTRVTIMPSRALTHDEGRIIGQRVVDSPPRHRPTGVFALNDQVAQGIREVTTAAGLEISIVGYDGQLSDLPFPTVVQPAGQVGTVAAQLLLSELGRAQAYSYHRHQQILLKPHLRIAAAPTG